MNTLWDLEYWNSSSWEKVDARLNNCTDRGIRISPSRNNMFKSLEEIEPDRVNVCIVGQDPYPDPKYATGRAFAVPKELRDDEFPSALKNLLLEYSSDLSLPNPSVGDLAGWVSQGVLLWNAIPSTQAHRSLSHDWREYDPLTLEVLNKVSSRGAVFIFIGAIARRYIRGVEGSGNRIIQTPHPSPRSPIRGRSSFFGSRIFSNTNRLLREIGKDPIDWRL